MDLERLVARIRATPRRQRHPHDQFALDAIDAGWTPWDYRGRYYYHGPAVSCARAQEQDLYRATRVRLQRDDLGLGSVLYPATSAGLGSWWAVERMRTAGKGGDHAGQGDADERGGPGADPAGAVGAHGE